MNKLLRKLNSENGMSLMIALIAFLVAIMVAGTIISAAYSAAKRVADDRETRQHQLALTSAAELVRAEMENTTCTIEETTGGNGSSTIVTASGTFQSEIKAACEVASNGMQDYSSAASTSFTIKKDGLPDVEVSYVMCGKDKVDENAEVFKLIFTMTIKETDETVFLEMSPTIRNSRENIREIEWNGGNIRGGAYE